VGLIVNQGPVNSWSFKRNRDYGSGSINCDTHHLIGQLGNNPDESKRHKVAKKILYNHLNNGTGRTIYNVGNVYREKEVVRDGLTIQPDIRIEHRQTEGWEWGGETFIEIVNSSAPHKNPNSWMYYDGKKCLVTIDVKDAQRGWEYDFEYLPALLLNKFKRYFFNRDNVPKEWDDARIAMEQRVVEKKEIQNLENKRKKELRNQELWEDRLSARAYSDLKYLFQYFSRIREQAAKQAVRKLENDAKDRYGSTYTQHDRKKAYVRGNMGPDKIDEIERKWYRKIDPEKRLDEIRSIGSISSSNPDEIIANYPNVNHLQSRIQWLAGQVEKSGGMSNRFGL